MVTMAPTAEPRQRDHPRPDHRRPDRRRVVFAALAAVLVLSAVVHLIGWHRDLPSPEVDEPYFVLPAVHMAASGSLDPHWFGHPGSTVILPLAVAYRAREVVFHGAPLLGAAPSVAKRFRADRSTFFLIGRAWTILLGLATVALVFLLARKLFGDLVGVLAALLFAVIPIVVDYGRTVRSDSAGACFAMLALLLIVGALERPSAARFAGAGAAVGLAIASRYFLVVLVPVAIVAWWWSRPAARRVPTPRTIVLFLVAVVAAFALVTPFFFLDWHAVRESLQAEAVGHVNNDHHTWLDNIGYYLFDALPAAFSWPALAVAGIGMVVAIWRRQRAQLLLVGYCVVFLGVVSLGTVRWERWIIPILPVLAVFAAAAVVLAARALAELPHPVVRRAAVPIIATVAVVGVAVAPARALVKLDQAAVEGTTRQQMRTWIIDHVPRGSRIAEEVKGPMLADAGYATLLRFELPTRGTIGDYLAHGYRYLLVNAYVALDYRVLARRYPRHAQFYDYLRHHGELVHEVRPHGGRRGPHLKLYRLDAAQWAASRASTGPHAHVVPRAGEPRFDEPRSFYPVDGDLMG